MPAKWPNTYNNWDDFDTGESGTSTWDLDILMTTAEEYWVLEGGSKLATNLVLNGGSDTGRYEETLTKVTQGLTATFKTDSTV